MDTTIDTLYDIYDIQTYRTQSIAYRMSLLIFLLLTFTGKIKRILEDIGVTSSDKGDENSEQRSVDPRATRHVNFL